MLARRVRVLFVLLDASSAAPWASSAARVPIAVARGAEEGLRALERSTFDLVVFDRAPGEAGKALWKAAQRRASSALVLAQAGRPGGLVGELAKLLDVLPEFAHLRDGRGEILYANSRFRETFAGPDGRRRFEALRAGREACGEPAPNGGAAQGEARIWKAPDGRTFELRELCFTSAEGERLWLEIGSDVTAEAAVRVALESARDTVESLPIGILTFRFAPPDHLVLFGANEAALSSLQGERAEWLGRPFEDLWPPEMVARAKGPLLDVAREGIPMEREVVVTRGDQIRRAFRVRAFRLADDRIVAAFEDVTAEKHAEKELARSEAQHRLLFEHAGVGIGYYSPDGRVIAFNRVARRWMGGQPEDYAGRSLVDLYGLEAGKSYMARLKRAAAGEVLEVEDRIDLPQGARWFASTYTAIPGHDDVAAHVMIVSLDITAQKEAEAAREAALAELERTRREMSLVVGTTNEMIAFYDLDLSVQWANRAAASSLGLSAEELRGRHCYELWHGSDRPCPDCPVLRARDSGRPQEGEMRTPDGRSWEIRGYPVLEGGEVVALVEFGLDVTARRAAEEERKGFEATLRQAQKLESIGTLASGIAHEINNPLMGMINYADLLAGRVGDPTLREFAQGIKDEGARVAGIVRNLLSFARGDVELMRTAQPTAVVESSLALFRSLLAKDGVEVVVDVPDGLPRLACRPHQIQQVLLNLLTNARDALNEKYPGGAVPGKRLRIVGRPAHGGCVRLTVEDEGIGIPSEHLDRVLDPFFTTKPRDRGTGLGLSVSYGIVRDHGGTLSIESQAGGPTRVHLDLPAVSEEEA
ncbi:MAG: PAS domain-containing protein [Candidatus Bipolaricaulota bacterium]